MTFGIPRTFLSLKAPQSEGAEGGGGTMIQPNTMGFEELVQRAGGQSEITTGTESISPYTCM